MTKSEIILSALAIAFAFVNMVYPILARRKFFQRKPFNCIMCLTGWASLGLSLINGYGIGSILFMIVGLFVGAMFEGIKMMYL